MKGTCTVRALSNGRHEVKISLTARTAAIDVAGYKVTTENYNGSYLTPIVEAMPGDTVAAHLVNLLDFRQHDGMSHGDGDQNPTNLHYFHGGIVSPNNARPGDAELGTGDNIYVHLKAGRDSERVPNSFDLKVPIPQALDARVLESTGTTSHPVGLNWYHSHLHGISSDQVMGGMSGLLSVGEATANVRAACVPSSSDRSKCVNDVNSDTADLRRRTKVRYALLRDLTLRNVKGRPDETGHSSAEWAPSDRDFLDGTPCGAWDGAALNTKDPKLRLGFCQRTIDTAWLFTLNGQRFPTITVEGGKNVLVRLGNVSANIGYWLELYNQADGSTLPLTLLSVDGIVPARPVSPAQAIQPVQAIDVNDLLLMPASRVEIYVRNDETPHASRQVYVLRTKGLRGIGADEWPEIQLARIVLEPNATRSKTKMGLNALVSKTPVSTAEFTAKSVQPEDESLPAGCVRDLRATVNEYRRVTFFDMQTPTPHGPKWTVKTEIIRPVESGLQDESTYSPDPVDGNETTIQGADGFGVPFEDYVGMDEHVDWTNKKHVCIKIDHEAHLGSHKQLWALVNSTGTLHNFHIHQMKFRLATKQELEQIYHILLPDPSQTCNSLPSEFPQPDYKCYDPTGSDVHDPGASPLWHDTIPMPPGATVFIVMSYDAPEQIGRFVFHCHILKHEDRGLMAPIEVWEPSPSSGFQKSTIQRNRK